MKRLEVIFCAAAILCAVLVRCAVPAGAVLATFSFLLLAIYYLVFTTFLINDVPFKGIFKKEAYKGIGAGRIVLGVFAGNALNIATLGILFGIMRWEGYPVMMLAAIAQLLLMGILTLVLQLIKPLRYKKMILLRIAVFVIAWLIIKGLNGSY